MLLMSLVSQTSAQCRDKATSEYHIYLKGRGLELLERKTRFTLQSHTESTRQQRWDKLTTSTSRRTQKLCWCICETEAYKNRKISRIYRQFNLLHFFSPPPSQNPQFAQFFGHLLLMLACSPSPTPLGFAHYTFTFTHYITN